MFRIGRSTLLCLGALALLCVAMFGDVLFGPAGTVLSSPGSDLTAGEADGRQFIFQALRSGRVVHWNPHLLSGTPCQAESQSAMFYPLNLPFLLLPIERAITCHIALHTWLLGAGMFLWARNRKLHPLACLVAGAAVMFSGPFFLHVHAGHLNNLAAMAWAPFLLLASDLIGDRRIARGVLLGSAALALQILSGQPQYVFYTGIAVLLYVTIRLLRSRERLTLIAAHAVLVLGAVGLAAVQMVPSWSYAKETVRSGSGTPWEFAAMFSFPPENVLTLLAPGFFGDMGAVPYWGRCYLWEMCLFAGITTLILAGYALAAGRPEVRRHSGVMIALLFVLALGSHTPLFRVLYEWVPGFNSLRGNSKFVFQAMLFLGMLAAVGMDALIGSARHSRKLGFSSLAAAAVLVIAAIGIQNAPDAWAKLGGLILATGESYLPPAAYVESTFRERSAEFAAMGLYVSAGVFAVVSALFFAPLPRLWRTGLLSALVIAEVFIFARSHRPSFDLDAYRERAGSTGIQRFLAARPGDYRVLQLTEPNSAMWTGAQNIWAYGAIPMRRYMEFMAFTQGANPDTVTSYLRFKNLHPLYAMLRCRFAILPGEKGPRLVEAERPMERLHLISDVKIAGDRDAVFNALSQPGFDPRQTVILESAPEPPPVASSDPGTVRVIDSSTDHLDIEAEVNSPAILLVTDSYQRNWKARPLTWSSQGEYRVMPANYVLRAIPLAIGFHKLRLEYVSAAFTAGKWVSLGSVAAWLVAAAVGISFRRRRPAVRAGQPSPSPSPDR